ncbi:hypothetical protein Tco_0219408, partial [Tanacetum coccineum]
ALAMRTASAAAKPCQGDSSEFYLITGSIYTEFPDGGSSFPMTSQSLKSKITTSIHKLNIEVKDYELKTKVKA